MFEGLEMLEGFKCLKRFKTSCINPFSWEKGLENEWN